MNFSDNISTNTSTKKLPKILNDFLNYCLAIKGLSINTIKGYTSDLKLFFEYLVNISTESNLNTNLDPSSTLSHFKDDYLKDVDIELLVNFLTYAQLDLNNSSYARARKVSCLKTFFYYLYDIKKMLPFNPCEHLEIPKLPKRQPIYLNLEESENLLKAVAEFGKKDKERDYCIMSLFLNCGLRLSELCSIDMNKIFDDTIKVIGKGNKERVIYLNKAAVASLEQYLPLRKAQADVIPKEYENALFISSKKMRISERTIERMVKKYAKLANLDYQILTPHKLRHTSATLMYKYGDVDIKSIQDILGHESISTTEIYTHIDEENLRNAVYANPLNDGVESLNDDTDR